MHLLRYRRVRLIMIAVLGEGRGAVKSLANDNTGKPLGSFQNFG